MKYDNLISDIIKIVGVIVILFIIGPIEILIETMKRSNL